MLKDAWFIFYGAIRLEQCVFLNQINRTRASARNDVISGSCAGL